MKKPKYVEATEIVKPGRLANFYVGIELERSIEKVSLLCVKIGDVDDIDIEDLDPKGYRFKTVDAERVHYLFSIASKRQSAEVIKSEVDLMQTRRNHRFCESKLKQFFGKPMSEELTTKGAQS